MLPDLCGQELLRGLVVSLLLVTAVLVRRRVALLPPHPRPALQPHLDLLHHDGLRHAGPDLPRHHIPRVGGRARQEQAEKPRPTGLHLSDPPNPTIINMPGDVRADGLPLVLLVALEACSGLLAR